MRTSLGLAAVIHAAAVLIGACSDDDPADYCNCDCGDGVSSIDADSLSECTSTCRDKYGADYVEDIYECAA